jgi:elongation factor G
MLKAAQEARLQMVEKIAELDDNLTVKYLEGAEISIDELKTALRKAIHRE